MVAVVEASAALPTGPAAILVSAPNLAFPFITERAPASFITIMTKSVACPPICKPKLPPLDRIIIGALQGPSKFAPLRQFMTPWPYWAPTMNPAFLTEGRIITQTDLLSKLIGRPFSLSAASSLNTVLALTTLSLGDSACARNEMEHSAAAARPDTAVASRLQDFRVITGKLL